MECVAMTEIQPTIAVIDDEPQMRKALRRLLSTHGYLVEDYGSGIDFLDALGTHPADCLILDLHMPEVSGFDVLEALDVTGNMMSVVVITGQEEPGTEERALGLGASAFLRKPVDETALLAAIVAGAASRQGGISMDDPLTRNY